MMIFLTVIAPLMILFSPISFTQPLIITLHAAKYSIVFFIRKGNGL